MDKEEHKKIVEEIEEDINEKLRRRILKKRQKIIGFSTSEVATNLFALFLHERNLISPGFNVNHLFFRSEKQALYRFNFDFENKKRIIELLINQERFRDLLCYGREKEEDEVKKAVDNYFKLKELLK